jgi:hypothetical protein
VFAIAAAGSANAVPPPPAELVVVGGEEAWHPSNGFRLDWRNPPASEGQAIAAVHYRVKDPIGAVAIGEERIGWATDRIDDLRVPAATGAYTAEVWLEDAAGTLGAPATVKLRFDDSRPADVSPRSPSGWISRNDFPYTLRIDHPSGKAPVSGIAGYAVSIDRSPNGNPCQAADRCSGAETDLREGAAGDAFTIDELAEGTSYAHAVAVTGSGMASTVTGHAVLRVDKTDPVTRLTGVPSGWVNQSVALTAIATDAASGMDDGGLGPAPFTAIRVDGGTPAIAAGSSVHTSVIEAGVHTIDYYARDVAGNANDGEARNGLPDRPAASVVVRIDRRPPNVAFVNSRNPDDPELIQARILDSLSGPSQIQGSIGLRPAGSGDRFETLPTERAAPGLSARWDSDAYAAGKYEFRAVAYDEAGNSAATERRADESRMVLSNPLKAPTEIRVSFGGKSPAFGQNMHERLLPYGSSAQLGGRLTAGHAPLAQVPVRIVERFVAGYPVERLSTITTAGDGTFSLRLTPGPSREVTAVFAGTPTLTRSASEPLSLNVRGGVRLRTSSRIAKIGGQPLVFSGKIEATSAAIPIGGKSVELQFRLPGLPWSEFRTIRTDRWGRFHYPYRFSDDDSRGVRFQFRAHIPAQGDWPYEPGDSRPVAVLGR